MANFKQALIDAMNQAGIDDREERAGIAAIAGGESGFQPRTEIGYQNTRNERIRTIFSKTRQMSDDELDDLKSDPVRSSTSSMGAGSATRRTPTTASPIAVAAPFS